jgi:hypothetical protein
MNKEMGVKLVHEEGCCGGPAPQDIDACCVTDANAKAAGEEGCGCNSTNSNKNKPTVSCC